MTNQTTSKKQAGKLTGNTSVSFHTRDCVSLFDGFVPQSNNSSAIKLSIKAFSARANLVVQNYGTGDPVAQEILVRIEQEFEDFIKSCQERIQLVKELMQPFEGLITTSSFSESPVERDCSNLAVYGMYGARACLILDTALRELMGAVHVTVMTKEEMETHRRTLKRKFRAILILVFQYKPKVDRNDFDLGNKHASEMLTYYREKLYIKQNDKRDDEELHHHYAEYYETPKMV